ncbi:SNRPN upstream reading frame protein isoform X1 [Talpa occidentalis]|nr:SNRPN upstream reading frame protein isoform X1 [Talpa occidentalis]
MASQNKIFKGELRSTWGSYAAVRSLCVSPKMAAAADVDRLHLRRTTEQHVPEVEVQVKRRRTASLSNQECQLYPRRSQLQQVPVVDFQAELRQAFLAETPRGG